MPSGSSPTGCPSLAPGRGRRIDLGHTEIAGGHLIERFRLFFIIALGETVLTMGAAYVDEPFEVEHLRALAIGFTGTVSIWWAPSSAPSRSESKQLNPPTTPAQSRGGAPGR